MNNIQMEIPFEWLRESLYFVTYYGDIYYGLIQFCPDVDDRFYIIQNSNLNTLKKLSKEEKTIQRYRELGWEITDPQIIKGTFPRFSEIGTDEGGTQLSRSGHQDWDKMFVFGAGASYSCVFGEDLISFEKSEYRPPLASSIFDKRFEAIIKKYPGVKQAIPEYIAKGKNFEIFFNDEWKDIRSTYNPAVLSKHINIQYYLQELFQKVSSETIQNFYRSNLYSILANKIQRYLSRKVGERIAFISFNHDTILEHYLEEAFRFRLDKMSNYFDWNTYQIMLFKPHGSSNWGWRLEESALEKLNSKSIPEYLFDNTIELSSINYEILGDVSKTVYRKAWGTEMEVNPNHLGKFTLNKNKIEIIPSNTKDAFFPAILMPYRYKEEFAMHYDHYYAMRWYVEHLQELYLIGCSGNDPIFNRMLNAHAHRLNKIIIVNPEFESVKSNLEKFIDIKKYEIVTIASFEDFVLTQLDSYLSH
jgi:hypothetical protein